MNVNKKQVFLLVTCEFDVTQINVIDLVFSICMNLLFSDYCQKEHYQCK